MTKFYLSLVGVIVVGCFAGYEAASRDLLQQVFLARKLTHRLAECLCAALVLLVQMLLSPVIWLCLIPPAVAALYALGTFGLNQFFKCKESKLCTEEHQKETRETALCTIISCLTFVGVGLLAYQVIAFAPDFSVRLNISAVEQTACIGISMGVDAMLLAALIHYLLVLRMHPNDGDNPSKELLKLRKELRMPHRI